MNQSDEIRQIAIGSWEINWLPRTIRLPIWAVQQARQWINRWQHNFLSEDTWASKVCGVHSVLVKVDLGACYRQTRQIGIFGVDDSPDGLGVATLVNPQCANRLEEVIGTWPPTKTLVLGGQTDDHVWLGEPLNTPMELASFGGQLLIRGGGKHELASLSHRSVTPCVNRNSRCWGERIGLWQLVGDCEDLPWKQGFALKPKQGMSCQDVFIWRKGRHRGSSRRADILLALEENGEMYCQPFVEPMVCPFLSNGREWPMVSRMFFAFDLSKFSYRYLGGFWLAREGNIRLHGARDAVVGPLL